MDVKNSENTNEPLESRLERELNASVNEQAQKDTEEKPDRFEQKQDKTESRIPDRDSKTLGVGEWMLVIFAFLIPLVNIVFMAMWAFSSEGNVHRRNFARASMLWLIILLVACVAAMMITGNTPLKLFGRF